MFKSSTSSIFQKQNKMNLSYHTNEEQLTLGQYQPRNIYRISNLERKLQSFGAMDEVEQDIINELNRSGQRLENLIGKVRGFLKIDPIMKGRSKEQRMNLSPCVLKSGIKQKEVKKSSIHNENGKGLMRLKDRVQKVLQEQDEKTTNIHKIKYLK